MSLPTRMRMFNIYGEELGNCSVNAGWWVDENGLYKILVEEFPSVVFDRPNVAYVEVYDFTFWIEMIQDFRKAERDDVLKVLGHIITISNEEYSRNKNVA